jgi:hypothetical protein
VFGFVQLIETPRRARGFGARRLEYGFPEWKAADVVAA